MTDTAQQSPRESGTDAFWVDRRREADRRDRPTRGWDALRGRGQRLAGRRGEEIDRIYVDRYRRGDVLLVVGIFVLNLLDAFFTLRWLQLGGREGNPLMEEILSSNEFLFLAQKCFVVGICLVVLVVHKQFRVARFGLWALFSVYGALVLYHALLQTFAAPVGWPS